MRARGELSPRCPWVVMKRPHGTGTLYVKWGSYYGRWLAPDGRRVNRRIGKVRVRGKAGGLTRAEAERGLRRLIEAESLRPPPPVEERPRTVDEVADELRERLAIGRVTRGSSRRSCLRRVRARALRRAIWPRAPRLGGFRDGEAPAARCLDQLPIGARHDRHLRGDGCG